MKRSVAEADSLQARFPLLSAEWDNGKNGELTPLSVSAGSHVKAWWLCSAGHSWQAEVKSRTNGNGCPVCSGKRTIPGVNDLASLYPDLVSEWHPTKNESLRPEALPVSTERRVWWQCREGHEWKAAVITRTRGGGSCPYCDGRMLISGENDLASLHPDIAAEWHPIANGGLSPAALAPNSNKKVWWQCKKGHSWQAVVASRVNAGSGCPYCGGKKLLVGFNDLKTRYPRLAAEWDTERNGISPDRVLPQDKKVYWKCAGGHLWKALVTARITGGSGCPVCAGKKTVFGENDLRTLFPFVAEQWAPDAEEETDAAPENISAYSNLRCRWQCERGHFWYARVSDRTQKGTGCPYCTGKRVLPGFNDLESQYPDVAAQWHRELNGILSPAGLTAKSSQKVWWQCREGHVWQAPVVRRTYQQRGCPFCAGNVGENKLLYYRRLEQEARKALIPRF